MAIMEEIVCKCGCGKKKMVRTVDIARGWGKFFSKSCKAKFQEKKTNGQYRRFKDRDSEAAIWNYANAENEVGWDGHK